MTTLDLTGVTADARSALVNNGLARVAARHLNIGSAIAAPMAALTAALASGDDSPDVDVAALNRRDLSSFVRAVESVIEITPNAGPLKRLVVDIVAADTAANPDALPLRMV
ncbi:hypothetical protein ABZW11_04915 [Nonomuraea sp. NPDC004580]|uniref:hypothetical protein n=1 Tax=Nonomuraea sp. NPDC004580 TaxID=3154552 RepID=UPI0033A4309E